MRYILLFFPLLTFYNCRSQQYTKPAIGAYYFDGWTGAYPYHITPKLQSDSFRVRRPKWGWITSTQRDVNDQINLAANAGLSFFSFCWYYHPASYTRREPLNNALSLYLKSPNNSRLKFCLAVINDKGYPIGPADWNNLTATWITYFKNPHYQKANGKPLLILYDLNTLIEKFGSEANVNTALNKLRAAAKSSGLAGVSVAVCITPEPAEMDKAQKCGFDILTAYNYQWAGFAPGDKEAPVKKLVYGNEAVWKRFDQTSLNYIPVTTLNWDPRPWANTSAFYANSPHYTGYSSNSVYLSLFTLTNWINAHPNKDVREKIGLVYAWNEYGEGAWLTPGVNDTLQLLNGVKRALHR